MSLFGKKKEKSEKPACCCDSANTTTAVSENETASECCGKPVEGICCIKVLGSGCKSCHQLYENAKKAIAKLGVVVEVEYITDMEKVMSYGVMSMPALVVNEKVVSMGKVLKPDDIVSMLRAS